MSYVNGSKDGYEKGFSDGIEGKEKSPVELQNLLRHVISPNEYTDTFLKGYAEGWKDGNRKRNKV